jgi:hypothetical protein
MSNRPKIKGVYTRDMAVYCTSCPMWFNTGKGWYAKETLSGLPLCPACGSVLMQLPIPLFIKRNKEQGEKRMKLIKTWEWPNGSYWKGSKAKPATEL